jgi:hypothetical protein
VSGTIRKAKVKRQSGRQSKKAKGKSEDEERAAMDSLSLFLICKSGFRLIYFDALPFAFFRHSRVFCCSKALAGN